MSYPESYESPEKALKQIKDELPDEKVINLLSKGGIRFREACELVDDWDGRIDQISESYEMKDLADTVYTEFDRERSNPDIDVFGNS